MGFRIKKRKSDYSDYSYVSADDVRMASEGDKKAMEVIFQRYRGYVRSVIYGTAKSKGLKLDYKVLEDIEQSVWEGLIKDIRKFR